MNNNILKDKNVKELKEHLDSLNKEIKNVFENSKTTDKTKKSIILTKDLKNTYIVPYSDIDERIGYNYSSVVNEKVHSAIDKIYPEYEDIQNISNYRTDILVGFSGEGMTKEELSNFGDSNYTFYLTGIIKGKERTGFLGLKKENKIKELLSTLNIMMDIPLNRMGKLSTIPNNNYNSILGTVYKVLDNNLVNIFDDIEESVNLRNFILDLYGEDILMLLESYDYLPLSFVYFLNAYIQIDNYYFKDIIDFSDSESIYLSSSKHVSEDLVKSTYIKEQLSIALYTVTYINRKQNILLNIDNKVTIDGNIYNIFELYQIEGNNKQLVRRFVNKKSIKGIDINNLIEELSNNLEDEFSEEELMIDLYKKDENEYIDLINKINSRNISILTTLEVVNFE